MRLLTILAGYCGAAAAGSLTFMLVAAMAGDSSFSNFGKIFPFVAMFGAVFAAPIALPVILFSEIRKVSSWLLFAAAGLISGLLLIVLITDPVELLTTDMFVTSLFLGTTTVAALTYWAITWRLNPPKSAAQ